LFLFLSTIAFSQGESSWQQWRGPAFNGSSTATGLPTIWSSTHNISWKTPLPGGAGSTPIISGERVFLTSLDNESKDLLAFCLNRKDGAILWKKVVGIGFADEGRGRNMASPSPVTDGNLVIFLFGSTDLVAFDFEGNELWRKNLQEEYAPFHILFGYHCSPLLYQNRLYIQVLQRDHPIDEPVDPQAKPTESFLLAFDPKTGKELFKHIRPTEAVEESHETYATPIPFEFQGRAEILMFGGDCISGHDPATGQEYWRWGSWNPHKINHWRVVPSPVTFEGLIYVCAPKGNPVYALKGGGVGQLNDEAIAWQLDKNTSDVCVPLIYAERIYVLDGDKKVLTCLDARTGDKKWVERLGGTGVFRGSPTGADRKIYLINEEGDVFVLKAGDEFGLLHQLKMGEGPCRSSVAVAGSELYLRTSENLYCIAEKPGNQ
jgi:outer membrane protein assembly factor BamB